jgi:hypothetical protein
MALTMKSSDTTRLASGIVSRATLLGSSSYLVDNFTVTNDMSNTGISWECIGEQINDGQVVISIDGSSGLSGYATGVLRFAVLTPQMGSFILNTILGGKYTNDVTISVYHPVYGQSVYTCKLRFPESLEQAGEKISASTYANVRMQWFRGSIQGNSWDESFDSSFS